MIESILFLVALVTVAWVIAHHDKVWGKRDH